MKVVYDLMECTRITTIQIKCTLLNGFHKLPLQMTVSILQHTQQMSIENSGKAQVNYYFIT